MGKSRNEGDRSMTRAEIRIAAARRRERVAMVALSRAYERKRAAVQAASDRTNPAIWAANRRVNEARQALAVAELAALGITPMKTITLWRSGRYLVRVTQEGRMRMVPVAKSGRLLAGRADRVPPYRWHGVTVTDQEVKE
jgi:hypothetical protein